MTYDPIAFRAGEAIGHNVECVDATQLIGGTIDAIRASFATFGDDLDVFVQGPDDRVARVAQLGDGWAVARARATGPEGEWTHPRPFRRVPDLGLATELAAAHVHGL